MEGAMVALAAQGEDNFARNDLALLEISAGDHRVEVLNNKKKIMVNLFYFILFYWNKRPLAHDSGKKYTNNSYILRFFRVS